MKFHLTHPYDVHISPVKLAANGLKQKAWCDRFLCTKQCIYYSKNEIPFHIPIWYIFYKKLSKNELKQIQLNKDISHHKLSSLTAYNEIS